MFRVDGEGRAAVLKVYFQHPDDARDRGRAEFSFSRFAWENSTDCVARPLAYDVDNGLGLYEFVEGRQLGEGEITGQMIEQTVRFYHALNRHKSGPAAARLPLASEACFSVASHLRCVDGRVGRLEESEVASALDREAIELVGELDEFWGEVSASVRRRTVKLGLDPEEEIPGVERCVSPSDFGFHNAILGADGRLRFIDFEYAGWDDPARLVCDFFCQPAIPVALDFFKQFVDGIGWDLAEPERHRERVALLWAVYRVKWCCILLNEFLAVGGARRRFAQADANQTERKASQLKKARRALETATVEWQRHTGV